MAGRETGVGTAKSTPIAVHRVAEWAWASCERLEVRGGCVGVSEALAKPRSQDCFFGV